MVTSWPIIAKLVELFIRGSSAATSILVSGTRCVIGINTNFWKAPRSLPIWPPVGGGGVSLSDQHCWFIMAYKPCHCLLFHVSVVSKTLCIHFSGQGSHYGYTHAWTKLHNEVMSWISGSYRCFSGFSVGCCINREKGYLLPTWVRKITFADVSTECSSRYQSIQSRRWLCMALTLKRTCDLMLLSVSSLPLSVTVLSCHVCVNLSRLQSRLPSRWHCALAVALHQQWAGHGTHVTIQECRCLVFLLYIHIIY